MAYFSNDQLTDWQKLAKIKNQLYESVSRSADVLDWMAFTADSVEDFKSVVGGSGNTYSMSAQLIGSTQRIFMRVTDGVTGHETLSPEFHSLDEFSDYISTDFPTYSSIMCDISEGVAANETIAAISGMFQSNVSLSISDVTSQIAASSMSLDDKTKLLTAIRAIAVDGRVSNRSWISAVSSICTCGLTAANQGTTIMDESSPFAIQSLVQTVLQAVTTSLPMIAIALGNAWGGLIFVASNALQIASQYLYRVVSNTLTVNPDSFSPLVHGPVKYCHYYYGDGHSIHPRSGFSDDWSAINLPIYNAKIGPFDTYMWKSELPDVTISHPHTLACNAFIEVGYDICSLINDLVAGTVYNPGSVGVSLCEPATRLTTIDNIPFWQHQCTYHTNMVRSRTLLYSLDWGVHYRLTQEKVDAIRSDPVRATRYVALALFLDCFLRSSFLASSSSSLPVTVRCAPVTTDSYWPGHVTKKAFNADWQDQNIVTHDFIEGVLCYLKGNNKTVTLDDDSFWPGNDILTTFIQNAYRNYLTVQATKDSSECSLMAYKTFGDFSTIESVVGYIYEDLLENFDNPYALWDTSASNDWFWTGTISFFDNLLDPAYVLYPDHDVGAIVDMIPTDRGLYIPDFTWSDVYLVAAAASVAAAVLIAGKTLVAKVLKKRITRKRLDAARDLRNKQAIYEDDPSNDEAWNAYYKAMKRYNLKANIFGWQTYDPVNTWFNDRTSNISNASDIVNTTSLLAKLQKSITG